jgi:hypothetical protein
MHMISEPVEELTNICREIGQGNLNVNINNNEPTWYLLYFWLGLDLTLALIFSNL